MDEDRDEIAERLSEAVRAVVGEYTPFVVVYDSAGLDPDAETEMGIVEGPHQRHYVTVGLLRSAEAYENAWGDDDE